MLLKNFNNFMLDELFLHEFFNCQYRSSLSWSRTCLDVFDNDIGKFNKYWVKKYIPYGDTLYYIIMKKSLYKLIYDMKKGKTVSLELFKNIVILVCENEIKKNKSKLDKGYKHYLNIKKRVINNTENLFDLVMVDDFIEGLEDFLTIKIDLKNYLESRKNKLSTLIQNSFPNLEWRGIPFFKIEIINIKKVSDTSFDIVLASILEPQDNLKHRSFFISFIIQYFYSFYSKSDFFLEKFKIGKPNINKVIVYNPLTLSRKTYTYEDINGIYQDLEMYKMLFIIINSVSVKNPNYQNCKMCEQNYVCQSRTNSKNKLVQRIFKK